METVNFSEKEESGSSRNNLKAEKTQAKILKKKIRTEFVYSASESGSNIGQKIIFVRTEELQIGKVCRVFFSVSG